MAGVTAFVGPSPAMQAVPVLPASTMQSHAPAVSRSASSQKTSKPITFPAVLGTGIGAAIAHSRRKQKKSEKKNRTKLAALGKEPGRELAETAQDRVFHWLGKAPLAGSPCFKSLQRYFPNALPSKALHLRTKAVLEEEFGFTPENTLLGS
eukprot:CAMPEP_0170606196 /NCGR_PEP_ID=MMETSP0224-20130122/20379_1 /TAXON_ID=285029 /ORGANISM="Togula jolla, Strain CCCM 725" /LENGTH=150 /DNA_ID=CAMNT_0010931253 /DNA_START=48 /DNA_END=496 /DNA_ORIENTATION=-